MFKATIAEFARMQEMKYEDACGVLNYLELKGVAKVVERRANSSLTGKGKKLKVFQLPLKLELELMLRGV